MKKRIEIDGVRLAICHFCQQPVRYPEGVTVRRLGEVHRECLQAHRIEKWRLKT